MKPFYLAQIMIFSLANLLKLFCNKQLQTHLFQLLWLFSVKQVKNLFKFLIRNFAFQKLFIINGVQKYQKMKATQCQNCQLCYPDLTKRKQGALIVIKLKKIIENENRKLHKKSVALPMEQYFTQLTEYLSLQLNNKLKFSNQCSHRIVEKYLIRKIEISVEQLYSICEIVCKSLSKRKYELQLIEKMSKNIHVQLVKMPISQLTIQTSYIAKKLKTPQNNIKEQIRQKSNCLSENSIQDSLGCESANMINKSQIFTHYVESPFSIPVNSSYYGFCNQMNNVGMLYLAGEYQIQNISYQSPYQQNFNILMQNYINNSLTLNNNI